MAQPSSQVPPPPLAPPKSRTGLYVVIAVVVIVVVILGALAAGGAFSPKSSPSTPGLSTITGYTFTPDYTGTTSGYLASSYTCGSNCPFAVAGGGTFTITLALTSTAFLFNHNIDDFTVTGGFTVVSVNPTLPIALSPGGSQAFSVTIQAPSVTGSYGITGTIVTN